MRPRKSRAPINQYEHDQRSNDHHNSRQSEPPNSGAISPTARRSVAPTTWRNVARVVHLIPFIEPNREITFYVRSGFGDTIASHEVYPEASRFLPKRCQLRCLLVPTMSSSEAAAMSGFVKV